jgi:GcrA cell cycle regulator
LEECEAASVVPPTTDAAPPPAIPAAEGRGSSALGGGTNADWPDADIARLRQLWADGLPTREIAVALGRTKNAVIGKANRIPLPARPDPNKWRRKNALKPRVKQPMALLLDPQKIGQENGSIRGGPRNRDMRALPIPRGQHGPARSCQWPTTVCKPWRFCEAVTVAGYSYCAGHKAQAFAA